MEDFWQSAALCFLLPPSVTKTGLEQSARGASLALLHNIFNYSNPAVDSTLVEYEKARTTDTAKNAYHKLHSQLADDLPYLFLWKLDTKSAWRAEVKDITISPYYYFTDINRWYVSK